MVNFSLILNLLDLFSSFRNILKVTCKASKCGWWCWSAGPRCSRLCARTGWVTTSGFRCRRGWPVKIVCRRQSCSVLASPDQTWQQSLPLFIEGILTEAVKNSDWILLDEVNMAPASVLECLSQLLESEGSITLYEAGDYKSIPRPKDFRLFACMNPATDTGKADLAPGLRNRFTELYCDEMADQADITMLVTD